MKIDTINQVIFFGEVSIFSAEEILLNQFRITSTEVTSKTTKLALHHLLNASILNNIQIRPREVNDTSPLSRSEESMTHFMRHQHVIHILSGIPVRQGKNTIFHVKGCSRHVAVLYNKVLSSKQAGDSTVNFFGIHAVRFV